MKKYKLAIIREVGKIYSALFLMYWFFPIIRKKKKRYLTAQ